MGIIRDSNIYNLADAAQAVVDRWNSKNWKESEHTAIFINKLYDELKKFNEENKI